MNTSGRLQGKGKVGRTHLKLDLAGFDVHSDQQLHVRDNGLVNLQPVLFERSVTVRGDRHASKLR